jgi:hypothetical protein
MSISSPRRQELTVEMSVETSIQRQRSLSQAIVELHGYTFLDIKGRLVACISEVPLEMSEEEIDCFAEIIAENPLEVSRNDASKLALKLFYRCNPDLFGIQNDSISAADFVDVGLDSEGYIKEVEVVRAFFAGSVADSVQMLVDTRGGLQLEKRNRKLLRVLAENSDGIKNCSKIIKGVFSDNRRFRLYLDSLKKLQNLALSDSSYVLNALNASIFEVAKFMCSTQVTPASIDALIDRMVEWLRIMVLASYGIVENLYGGPDYSFTDSHKKGNVPLERRIARFDAVFKQVDSKRIKLPFIRKERIIEFFHSPKTVEEALSFFNSFLTEPEIIHYLTNRMASFYYNETNFNKLLDAKFVDRG